MKLGLGLGLEYGGSGVSSEVPATAYLSPTGVAYTSPTGEYYLAPT